MTETATGTATATVPRLVRSFDPWIVPLTTYEVETPSPEENVAVALTGIAGAVHRDHWWYGQQRLRGGVKFGEIDYALVRRARRTELDLTGMADDPVTWTALALMRGSIRESDGVTRVRLVFRCGNLIYAFVLAAAAWFIYLGVQVGFHWELAIAPAFAWLAMLGVHRISLRWLRPLAFAALGLEAR